MNSFKIFLVEDDVWYGKILQHYLSLNPDYEIHWFQTGKECLKHLHLQPDVICMDYNLPDTDGNKLLKNIQTANNSIPVIIISGQEEVSVAVKLLKEGVKDYIIKDDNAKDVLWKSLLNIRENATLKEEVQTLKKELGKKFQFEKTIIGQSEAIKSIYALVEKAINSNIKISITGETGTGKEVIAKAIHYNGTRQKEKFVAVNMAAIPTEMVESELFGYEKGSFTGATNRKIGKFELANGGTLFLDEIAELDLNLQSKILRALQEGEICRLGGNETIKIDIRLITATHKDLMQEVNNGTFREDLFYRIVGLPIKLPPLRERGEDFLILTKSFMEEYAKENNELPFSLEPKAIEKLRSYAFPGNIRELKSIIELACVLCNNNTIADKDIVFSSNKKMEFNTNHEKTLKEYNQIIIQEYLRKYNNNVIEVALKLDIGKSTIYNMLKAGEIVV